MATAKRLASGNYRIRVYIGKNADGKPQYKSFTAKTKKEAEFMAAQYSRMNIDLYRSDMLLKQAVERYIKSKENILSPSTIRGYYAILRKYLPDLMQIQVKKITAEIVQDHFNQFAISHSPKTCRNAHGLISAVLKVNRPELQLNTTLPQKEKKSIYVPDEQEVQDIYKLIKGTNLEIPFVLATQCGLRASEIAALRCEHIKEGFLIIEQAAVLGADNQEHLKKPKSYSGYRQIPITPELASIILNKCADKGKIVEQKAINICNNWVKFRTKHNLPKELNFHALRHHYASKCLLLGIPQKYIAELMGHNSLDLIEKVYQHTFPSAMEMYTEKIRDNISKSLI